MSDPILSPEAFKWFLTITTGGLAGSWLVYDTINLIRLPSREERDPGVRHDKKFGYLMGILIGAAGVWGCLMFHDVV